jgi:hypothetical protein
MGTVRPDACSSSTQSRTDSDWEPIAARAASKGRHLAGVIKRKNLSKKNSPVRKTSTTSLLRRMNHLFDSSLEGFRRLSRKSLQ